MNWLSPYLIALVATWVIAHIIKYFIDIATKSARSKDAQPFRSGGMPSAHAATTTAVWMVVLVKDGWTSGLFALTTLFLLVMSHDAVRVRRATGEQGETIGSLIDETKSKLPHPRAPKGHTPAEVGVGWLLGLIVGGVVVLIF